MNTALRDAAHRTYRWLAGRRLVTLFTMLLLVAGTWAFIELADEVLEGETQAFDEAILEALRQGEGLGEPIGPSWVRGAARDLTSLGSAAVLVTFTFVAAGYLLLVSDYFAAGLVLAATWTGQAVCMALKTSLDRARPDIVPHWDDVMTASFPSGHSMMAAVVYLTLGVVIANFVRSRPLKSYCIAVAVTLTILVGASRIVLGVHYPTDVLAGWTAGLVWAILCGSLVGMLKRRHERRKAAREAAS
ncbi:MAG: phosphatase PAP2 family protein [Planctomycetes bacterium]|nr:phosphatase PAP2 family protein [Planctomycetota bacterium]